MGANRDQMTSDSNLDVSAGISRRHLLAATAAGMTPAFVRNPITAAPDPHSSVNDSTKQAARNHVQAIVSSHELATEAGFTMLGAGGTAADSAVAVATMLTVVEPWFSSALGGGTWALYYDAETGTVTSLDGVGPVGRKVDVDDYESRVDEFGIHQAIVPGAWDGWMLWLDRYGRLGLDEILAPAITTAREGYPASKSMIQWLDILTGEVFGLPSAKAIYTSNNEFPKTGDTIVQADMAATFESLSQAFAAASSREAGIQAARDYYYRGPIAEAIVKFSDANDGYFAIEDFNEFSAEIVDAISIDYTDSIQVFQSPPNSQGVTMLLALNILKGIDFSGRNIDDPFVYHAQIEALKLAFADRYAHIGDPDRIEIPLETLLSDEYADLQRDRIDPESAMEWPIESGLATNALNNTTTFHIVDGSGNAAAVTTSLGAQFLVVDGTGIHINERMQFLALEPDNANALTPGYKVRHTSCPYLVTRNGRLAMVGGNTGVDTQPQGQTQQFISVVDFGTRAQFAINRPRFVTTSSRTRAIPIPSKTCCNWKMASRKALPTGSRKSATTSPSAKGYSARPQ